MSESQFLPEIFIDPKVFDEKIKNNDLIKYIIEELLSIIGEHGTIINLSPAWYKEVMNNLNNLGDAGNKRTFKKLLLNLKKQNTIVNHLISDETIFESNTWKNLIEELENVKKIDFKFSSDDTFNKISQFKLSKINPKGEEIVQNKDNFKKMCLKIVPYAKIVRLYDPYYDLKFYNKKNHEIKDNDKYIPSLEIISQIANSHRDLKLLNNIRLRRADEISIIKIHTLLKSDYTNNLEKYFDLLKEEIKTIVNKFQHTVEIYLWDEWKDKNRKNWRSKDEWKNKKDYHDRFITTERCCIQVGNGLDITNKNSSWSDMGSSTKQRLTKEFDEKDAEYNTPYELIRHIKVEYDFKSRQNVLSSNEVANLLSNFGK